MKRAKLIIEGRDVEKGRTLIRIKATALQNWPAQQSAAGSVTNDIATRVLQDRSSRSQSDVRQDIEGIGAVTKTRISTFSRAAEQAQQWVNEVAGELDWEAPRAYRFLKSVLHALRDWLPPEELSDLAAQMPVLIRGVLFEGWRPLNGLGHDRRKGDFIIAVRGEFGFEEEVDFDRGIGAVFHLLDRHVSGGEVEQVRNTMRKALRQLWPAD